MPNSIGECQELARAFHEIGFKRKTEPEVGMGQHVMWHDHTPSALPLFRAMM